MNDFEGFVLAAIESGARSGYAIRLRLDSFGFPRWSSESGSSYRVLRRLEIQGYIEETGRMGVPKRQRVEYGLTERGKGALEHWLMEGPGEDLNGIVDTSTYRAEFLSLLEPSQQRAALRQWIRSAQHLIRALRSRQHKEAPFAERIVLESYVEHAKARERWLKFVQNELKSID